MSKLARDHRNSELAKIHIAKEQLGWTDEVYRDMLWTQGRVRSAKDLDYAGRQRVLDYLRAQGFGNKKRPTPAPDKLKLVKRIRAQLISLGKLPDTYADGIAKQMFGLQFYEWGNHDQLHAITAALGVEQRKKGVAIE